MNPFIGLPLATLTSLQTAYISAITALASNAAYSLNGRSLTRASLPDCQTALAQITAAINVANGATAQTTYVSFTGN